jgi:peptidyl-prolyl cis-trans isomerase SurA
MTMFRSQVAAALALVTAFAAGGPLRAEIFEQVLVKVNGEIITKSEFEQRQVAELRNRPELSNVSPNSLQLRQAINEITPGLILTAVDELLLIQRGRELGYVMGDEQFNNVLSSIKKQNNLEDDQKFLAALKQEGLTLADFRRNVERNMLVSQVQRVEVNDKISVNDEEARAYYAAHPREFTTPSELTLRELLIEVPTSDRGVNVAQDDEAKAKAEEIRKRLLEGEPFARLAADFSAAASKANGGLIGPINHDELDPRLQKVLDALPVGGVTEPLRTQRGYQLLKVESRTETRVKTFEQARNEIGNRVGEQKRQAELLKYLDQLRQQATVTWRNDDLKRAYEQALEKRRKDSAAAAATASTASTAAPSARQ